MSNLHCRLDSNIKVIHAFAFGLLLLLFASAAAQEPALSKPRYQMPPKAIADLVDAPRSPVVSISPDQEWMLLLE